MNININQTRIENQASTQNIMRNIYDQYSQPENKITHALACSLGEDKKLLQRFVKWITGTNPSRNLEIVEQRLPGDPELNEGEAERRGLPDAWIFNDENWSLIIESKVSANLTIDQLQRHYRSAIRRGFNKVTILVIDVVPPGRKLPDFVVFKTWSDIYCWLCGQIQKSDWALKTARYLEVAESRLPEEGYLKKGTLTVFTGVPFGKDEPYNYLTAKRILNLAMEEFRKRKDLVRLGMDPEIPGRSKISGKYNLDVWDYLSLKDAESKNNFTKYPHLSFAVENQRVYAAIVVPNGIKPKFRKNLADLGEERFNDLIEHISKNLLKVLKKEKRAAPIISVVQRRYPTQSSPAILDAYIRYDLRTAFDIDRRKNLRVKQQPQWLNATYQAITNKKSNLQFSVGAVFPYQYCKVQQTREILDYVANVWIAGKPLLDTILKGKY